MSRCSACSAKARKLRNAHVLRGRAIKPGRVCSACARLGWLLVLGEDTPPARRPDITRLARGIRSAGKALAASALAEHAIEIANAGRPRCNATAPSGERCELAARHKGQHSAPRTGSKVFARVLWRGSI